MSVSNGNKGVLLKILNEHLRVTYACALLLLFASLSSVEGRAGLPSFREKKVETVTLTRRLSPVAPRNGTTVALVVKTTSAAIPPEAAAVLEARVQTLLLDAKAGDIKIVEEGAAETVIKCTITGYEPKSTHPNQRQIGLKQQTVMTWIGNVEASVQVTDNRGRPIVATNLKYHLENDFVTSETEKEAARVDERGRSFKDKLADSIMAARGGSATDMAGLVGQKGTANALTRSQEFGARPPTDAEWRDGLLEGMGVKIASLIVPVNQDFQATMPTDKAFDQIRTLAKDKRWGDVQEQAEKMSPLPGANDASRLYLIGLSYEALAYSGSQSLKEAADELNRASLNYTDAAKATGDREFSLADMRVRDSIDHYVQIEHFVSANPSSGIVRPDRHVSDAQVSREGNQGSGDADNAALIDMVGSNLSEPILLTYVQTVTNPKFDASAPGLMALSKAKVSPAVIAAVQKRMSPPSRAHTAQQAPRRSTTTAQ